MKANVLHVSKYQNLDSKLDSLVPEFILTSFTLSTVIKTSALVYSLCPFWSWGVSWPHQHQSQQNRDVTFPWAMEENLRKRWRCGYGLKETQNGWWSSWDELQQLLPTSEGVKSGGGSGTQQEKKSWGWRRETPGRNTATVNQQPHWEGLREINILISPPAPNFGWLFPLTEPKWKQGVLLSILELRAGWRRV